jgi:hypothetical protein
MYICYYYSYKVIIFYIWGDAYEGIEKSLLNQWLAPCRSAAAAVSARTISMMTAQGGNLFDR